MAPGWSANRKLSRNGLIGSAEIDFHDTDKSQVKALKVYRLGIGSSFSAARFLYEILRNTSIFRVSQLPMCRGSSESFIGAVESCLCNVRLKATTPFCARLRVARYLRVAANDARLGG